MKIKIRLGKADVKNSEKKLYDFVLMLIFSLFLTNAAQVLYSITEIPASTVGVLAKVIMAILFLRALPLVLQRISKKMIFLGMGSILITLLNVLFFRETLSWFGDTALTYYTMCYSSFLICSAIRDFTALKGYILKISSFIAILSFVILFFGSSCSLDTNTGDYSMGFGYACIPSLLFLIYSFFENRKWKDLLGIISLFFAILLFGSRGPLLSIALFGVFFGLRYLIKEKKYLLAILLCVILICVFVFYQDIFMIMVNICEVLGVNSRTITMMSYDTIIDSGRSKLYDVLLLEVAEHPFQIRGINAEYIQLGGYAHNIIIELLYQFGIIVGGMGIVYLLKNIVKTLFLDKVDDKNVMIWIFAFSSLPHLMISNSLWTTQNFWIWLALII